ncbi:uncharacterized protein PG998_002852 [Apiospora kogelbergensis]|uniref:uncharacterized protein n=1 Tax=Apiospora kogelbergensis TaxID=1337665 RepID=UPI003130EBD6
MLHPKPESTPPPGVADAQTSSGSKEGHAVCEPCRQIRFAFGRNGNHFFYASDHLRWQWTARLPEDTVSNLGAFSSDEGGEIYTVAISADGAVLLAGKEKNGAPVLRYAGVMGPDSAFQLAYKKLWDTASAGDAARLNITFGPHGSYYCLSSPPPTKKPRQVALGIHDTWICLWSDYSHSYHLGSHYPLLAAQLDQTKNTSDESAGESDRIAFVALNPWQADAWLMVDCKGMVTWENAPAGSNNRAGVENVRTLARDYMQRRARRTGATFTTSFSYGDREALAMNITPHTRHDDGSLPVAASVSNRLRLLRDIIPPPLLSTTYAINGGAVVGSTAVVCRLAGFKLGKAVSTGFMAGCVYTGGYLNAQFKK